MFENGKSELFFWRYVATFHLKAFQSDGLILTTKMISYFLFIPQRYKSVLQPYCLIKLFFHTNFKLTATSLFLKLTKRLVANANFKHILSLRRHRKHTTLPSSKPEDLDISPAKDIKKRGGESQLHSSEYTYQYIKPNISSSKAEVF